MADYSGNSVFGGGDLESDLLAAGVNDLTGSNWGNLLADGLATPGAYRVKLNYDAGGDYVSITATDGGQVAVSGAAAGGAIANGRLTLWGRLPAEAASSVREAIEAARAAAGLAELFGRCKWRLLACGIDNPAVQWGTIKPQPPVWWVAVMELDNPTVK